VLKSSKVVFASSVFALSVMSTVSHAASTGTITFTGKLDASTCDVSVDGQGENATVVLPTASTTLLKKSTDTTGRTGFNMELKNCTGTLTTASAFFEAGANVDTTTGRLKNTVVGGAGLVSLQLLDGTNSKVIKAGDQSQIKDNTFISIASSSAVLPYAVQYYAEGATTPGEVSSSVVYSIQYK